MKTIFIIVGVMAAFSNAVKLENYCIDTLAQTGTEEEGGGAGKTINVIDNSRKGGNSGCGENGGG